MCDHQECYKEVGSQAISYTTGVPAMCLSLIHIWHKEGMQMEFWFSEFHTPDVKHSIRVNKQLYSKPVSYTHLNAVKPVGDMDNMWLELPWWFM